MAGLVYGLCAIEAFLCAWFLLQTYRKSNNNLLLWGGLCFVGLTVSNILLIIDKLMLPTIDLSVLRNCITLSSLMVLIYGLIWNAE